MSIILNNIETKKFVIGETIFREGEIGNKAYVIKSGFVEVFKKFAGDQQIRIAKLGPGQIFGEMSLFDNGERTATIIASSDLEVHILDKNLFDAVLTNSDPLVIIILKILVKRLKKTSRNLAWLQT